MENELATGKHFKIWARMGYAARGLVYLAIGALALQATFAMGGKMTDSKGALSEVKNYPFGEVLLWLMVVGLSGYVVWRLLQSILDADNHGWGLKAVVVRGALLISALTHAALAYWLVQLLISTPDQGGQSMAERLPSSWLILGFGLVLFGVAGAHIVKGWNAGFERYVSLPAEHSTLLRRICQFGLIARGLVWAALGWIFVRSGLSLRQIREEQGTGDALAWFAHAPYGQWVLALIAAGLMAFGCYSLIEAKYRRINTPEEVS